VYYYFRRLLLRTTLRERQKTGVWQQMNNTLRQQLRQIEGRNPQPSAAICASQQRNALASLWGAQVEVVKRSEAGFQVLPRRWVVERNERLVGALSTPK
jgi:transposase